jgi:hypothetical protein
LHPAQLQKENVVNKSKYLAAVPLFGIALALSFSLPASSASNHMSVHPSAFVPSNGGASGYYYQRESLANNASSNSIFFAPVNLPHGATVTKVTLYFYDPEDGPNGTLTLERVDGSGSSGTLALVATSGYASYVWSWSDDIIANATIDNSQYIYFLRWDCPAGLGIQLRSVFIEYSFQTSLPAALRSFSSSLRGR